MNASATAPTQTTSTSRTMRNRRKAAADRTVACAYCSGIGEHAVGCPAFDPGGVASASPDAAPRSAVAGSVPDGTLAALGAAFGVPVISADLNGEPARVVLDDTQRGTQSDAPPLRVPTGEEYWVLFVEAEDRVRVCEEAIAPFKTNLSAAKKTLALIESAGKQAARERKQGGVQSGAALELHVPTGEEYWVRFVEAEDRVRACEEALIPFKSDLAVAKKRLARTEAAGKQAARESKQMKLGEAS